MSGRVVFAAAFVLLVLAGTVRDRREEASLANAGVLSADLHVHPFPGDGVLTVRQLQREASRRGLDVIAVTGHNNRVALRITRLFGTLSAEPLILESQELTSPQFHIIAVGVHTMIDWRLSVPEAVAAIHAQGGAAIAAHPVRFAWEPMDDATLRSLDGIEVAHPMAQRSGSWRREIDEFAARVRAVNADVAPIGSTDFHTAPPLGLCRTYLLTADRSAEGTIAAIRQGRTVARDQFGRLFGRPEHIAEVERALQSSSFAVPAGVPTLDRLITISALLALALSISGRVASKYASGLEPNIRKP